MEADYHTLSERFRITLEKWLQLNVGVTWGNLELALTNANCESLGLHPLTAGKCISHQYSCYRYAPHEQIHHECTFSWPANTRGVPHTKSAHFINYMWHARNARRV